MTTETFDSIGASSMENGGGDLHIDCKNIIQEAQERLETESTAGERAFQSSAAQTLLVGFKELQKELGLRFQVFIWKDRCDFVFRTVAGEACAKSRWPKLTVSVTDDGRVSKNLLRDSLKANPDELKTILSNVAEQAIIDGHVPGRGQALLPRMFRGWNRGRPIVDLSSQYLGFDF